MASDLEIIALSCLQAVLTMESEREFFIKAGKILPGLIERIGTRRNYNNRRRHLSQLMEQIRMRIASWLVFVLKEDPVYIVDSMPLPICRLARAARCRICRDEAPTQPNKGYCASQMEYYFGFKFHAVCSLQGVFLSYAISSGSMHDINALSIVRDQFQDCTIIGDKAYISAQWREDLFTYSNVQLEVPSRANQRVQVVYSPENAKQRKRIETNFSQLVCHLGIRKNYATSACGLTTRIAAKMMAFTLFQYSNYQGKRHVGQIKGSKLAA